MNMPGFTADSSLHKSIESYTARITPSGGQNISGIHPTARIPRLPVGGGGGAGGFWGCAVCVAACTIVVGDPSACYWSCKGAGACESAVVV
jgi:hypothetical protein